ncbi:hypothetical protein D3C87_1683040 [compost metagenome]
MRACPFGDLVGTARQRHALVVQHAEQRAQLLEGIAFGRLQRGVHVHRPIRGIGRGPDRLQGRQGQADAFAQRQVRQQAGRFFNQQLISAENEIHK